ncbi:MAG: competence/damage-inducible protein A [Deltaproteobacteria bacterium]|nr:competence/damage-inducible protein A [Deltaproteobacteria bacterium]
MSGGGKCQPTLRLHSVEKGPCLDTSSGGSLRCAHFKSGAPIVQPTAEILTIGDELLRGDLVDTNSGWLATRLGQLGLPVTRITSVGDDLPALVAALEEAAGRARVLLVSGGLGPTDDDRTSAAVAQAAGVPLELDAAALETIRARFAAVNLAFTPNNEKQAYIPRGARLLPNARGTAPGFSVRVGACDVCCVPGVPSEMRGMFDAEIAPALERELGLAPVRVRTLRTFGLSESKVDHELRDLLSGAAAPGVQASVHYRAQFPETHVILVVRSDAGSSAGAADAALGALEAEVRRRLGANVYGADRETFSEAVVAALKGAGARVALAESCTGGLAADLLTRASGASEVFELGLVTYANAFKTSLLGVPEAVLATHGAVSQPCVEAMAAGVRERAGATLGLAISGIAGPTGGTPDKPVGTVHFALASAAGVRHLERQFRYGERDRIKLLAAYVGLWLVYRAARGELTEPGDLLQGRWTKETSR